MKSRLSALVFGILLLAVAGVLSSVVGPWRSGGLVAGIADAGKGSCPEQPAREFRHAAYYTGPLCDAHLHLPSSSSIVSSVATKMRLPTPAWGNWLTYDYVRCLFKAEGTRGAFGFHLLTRYSLSGEVSAAKALERKKLGITHFLMPTFISSAINPSVESVRKILEKNQGLFKGIGELKFFDGTSPDSPKVQPYYDLAEEYGLIAMMHPFSNHKEAVNKVVEQYPKITFLLHGIDSEGLHPGSSGRDNVGWVLELLRAYRNVYYSVDDAPMWQIQPTGEKIEKTAALPRLRADFNAELDRLTRRWKAGIEEFPDRILSGTDRWYEWHFDREASALIIEFKRSFIGRLSPGVQEKYAYRNAEKLLQK